MKTNSKKRQHTVPDQQLRLTVGSTIKLVKEKDLAKANEEEKINIDLEELDDKTTCEFKEKWLLTYSRLLFGREEKKDVLSWCQQYLK